MLKWLVTKGPPALTSENEPVVTTDPVAALANGKKKDDPVYAISRVNPIFEDRNYGSKTSPSKVIPSQAQSEDSKDVIDFQTLDQDSVRSSGYGSKGTDGDSVSLNSDFHEENFGKENEDELRKYTIDDFKNENGRFSKDNFRNVCVGNKKTLNKTLSNDSSTDLDDDFMTMEHPLTVAELRKSFENLTTEAQIHRNPLSTPNDSITEQISMTERETDPENTDFNSVHGRSEPFTNFGEGDFLENRLSGSLEVIHEVSSEFESENSPKRNSILKYDISKSHAEPENVFKYKNPFSSLSNRERLKNAESKDKEQNRKQLKKCMIKFNPLVDVVKQNEDFVTSISLTPFKTETSNSSYRNFKQGFDTIDSNFGNQPNYESNSYVPYYFSTNSNQNGHNEYPLLSIQPDSLVTDETLKMMNNPNKKMGDNFEPPVTFNSEDIPKFDRVLFSNFQPIFSKSSSQNFRIHNDDDRYSRKRMLSRKKGIHTVKNLWEKTGLKTNGRKLLVDLNETISDDENLHLPAISTSYGSTTENRNSVFVTASPTAYSIPKNYQNQRFSNSYKNTNFNSFSRSQGASSTSRSYEEIANTFKGVENKAFLEDISRSPSDCSLKSKSSHSFRCTLTNFQKRVSEKLQGEPDHRSIWVESEILPTSMSDNNLFEEKFHSKFQLERNKAIITDAKPRRPSRKKNSDVDSQRTTNFKSKSKLRSEKHGLSKPFTVFDHNSSTTGIGQYNESSYTSRMLNGLLKKGSVSRYFRPYPNVDSPLCTRSASCQDFTLDQNRSYKLLKISRKTEKRRKIYFSLLIIVAILGFIATVVAFTIYFYGDKSIFGTA